MHFRHSKIIIFVDTDKSTTVFFDFFLTHYYMVDIYTRGESFCLFFISSFLFSIISLALSFFFHSTAFFLFSFLAFFFLLLALSFFRYFQGFFPLSICSLVLSFFIALFLALFSLLSFTLYFLHTCFFPCSFFMSFARSFFSIFFLSLTDFPLLCFQILLFSSPLTFCWVHSFGGSLFLFCAFYSAISSIYFSNIFLPSLFLTVLLSFLFRYIFLYSLLHQFIQPRNDSSPLSISFLLLTFSLFYHSIHSTSL
ncbi:unnamed protein product [Acanthosepion pharaonis]|uniref:Uncharacterized protein n=1 Tax=Acanthosepion pharaonis TaxID=158019 RepID=A0A812D3U8_ACAPH|nr:unnamed protein product [Sepia pharaonis]